ncbi:cobalamin biosynthesis protein [Chrysosporum bergii ANA360D]|jgi:cobalamin biosynthesis protein CbiG|uniref:Cobalamin biosynthesis protein n=1 Tax=Chrysosporum bergii ANA360D TaxID=617107 RepID=A0AA43GRP1_9CYAN|nr:cobalamin biosynthesis protein [Chrysosporum bergii]MDH6060096.1 cobalamin biosynthesis protein [Chrysosporum bergii ANA360D]
MDTVQKLKLWVGIGCQKGSSQNLIATAIKKILPENQLQENAIAGLATIETKATEVGLIELCRLRSFTLKTFSPDVLSTVIIPNPSNIAQRIVGTSSVAEASAILAASHLTPSLTINQDLRTKLLIPKRIFRLQGESGAVTLAVAAE